MRRILAVGVLLAVGAVLAAPAFAAKPTPTEKKLQAQVAALQKQVPVMQTQVKKLQTQVSISRPGSAPRSLPTSARPRRPRTRCR